jgi:DNA-binding CsgD family transcriptional regulator
MAEIGLVGRVESRDFLLRALGEGAQVALVLGGPGTGKTALLAAVAAGQRERGVRVVEVTGQPLEEGLAFAALVELLSSLEPVPPRSGVRMDELTLVSSDPLRQRLEVLRRVEELSDGPVLIVVDDAQWIDASSLSVLAFVANRISGSSVAMVVAARGEVAPPGFAAHPVVPLPRLDNLQSRLVLRRTGLDLDDSSMAAIVTASTGNPLALLELARAAASGGITPTDALVPMPERLERAFAAELPELPAVTRALLVLAAAGADDLGSLYAVSDPVDVLAGLEPAERCGLLKVGGGRIHWRHPLARAATYAAATADERHRAHLALAALPTQAPDRRAWHLSHAALGPDEEVAAELEDAAVRAQASGGYLEACRAMHRSAELSADPHERSRRLVTTAELAAQAGEFTRLQEFGRQVHQLTDDPELLTRVDHSIAYALGHTTRQRSARLALLGVLERSWQLNPTAAWSTLTSLAALAVRTGEGNDALSEWQQRLESVDQPVPPPFSEVLTAARAWVRSVAGGPSARTPELVELVLRPSTLEPDDPPDIVFGSEMLLGSVAWLVDEHHAAQSHLARAVELMQGTDATSELPQTLLALAHVQFELGRWEEAEETSRLLSDVAEARGLDFLGYSGAEVRARVAAVRGDAGQASEIVQATEAAVDRGEWASLTCDLIRTKGLTAVGARDHALAYAHLRGLFRDDGTPLHWRTSLLGIGDLAAAAVRTGRGDQVVRPIEWAVAHVGEHPSARVAMAVARAVANTSGAEAGPSFEEAVAVEGGDAWPFELANARLEYGVWLRRQRRPTLAREQLQAALTTFDRLGAPAWVEMARSELRASGVATDGPGASSLSALTTQERHIVRLAATGLSNREIAEALFLSPRTVGTHLHHAFPKLGVTTRGRLRDVVDGLED